MTWAMKSRSGGCDAWRLETGRWKAAVAAGGVCRSLSGGRRRRQLLDHYARLPLINLHVCARAISHSSQHSR